ncbi:phosphatase PAP2 family protein [Anaerotignum sp.]|uniref:phosphatase PAP2 family protein n=1 Tax=Anaerotignum sp. TaxID=2039241 RepID=UPI002714DD2B|nr:phosphatase PAP2 family protein [Anaerotignum sp.]
MDNLQLIDIMILTQIRSLFHAPWLDKPMILISTLGNNGFLWIALAVIFFSLGNKKKPWRAWGILLLFCLAANILVCNVLLKPMVARIRPYDLLGYDILVPRLADFSFPSGHTSASFAAAAVIYTMNKKWGIVVFIFAALMGFSRLYLGVHFPSDVLAGALLGWIVARVVICIYTKTHLWK